jgi:hypothetical protein
MPRGRALAPLTVTADERETLERWLRRRKTAHALAQRASLVLAAAGGLSNQAVAVRFRVTPWTVGKWRQRFWRAGWMGCWMSPGRERRARSGTRMWSAW